MSFLSIKIRTSLAIKFTLISLLLMPIMACGDDNNRSNEHNRDGGDVGDNDLPTTLLETLSLNANEQLFSLKQSGGSSSLSINDANTSLRTSISTSDADTNALMILDEKGNAKRYLADARFDQFHVVKNGSELAYIARINESDFQRLKLPGGGWMILKKGQKPIPLKRPPIYQYIRDPSEFIGQTETSGGLVFSYGTYVDLDGKDLSYGKNISDVTQAQFVSGDFVALHRKLNGKEVTTLVNVKPKTSGDPMSEFRRNYDNYFTPDFVQITNDGKGLMSDIHGSLNFGANPNSLISRLEEEFDEQNVNSGKRSTFFPSADLNGILWFNASARLPNDTALLTCYVHGSGYRLMRVTKDTTAVSGWKFKELFTIKDSTALNGIKVARPFIQGNNFTLVRNDGEILYINHTDMKKTGRKKVAINVGSVFDVRPSNDLTQFIVLGEKANGEQAMAIYDGSTGDLVETKDIDVK